MTWTDMDAPAPFGWAAHRPVPVAERDTLHDRAVDLQRCIRKLLARLQDRHALTRPQAEEYVAALVAEAIDEW